MPPTPASVSWYVTNYSTTNWYNRGCSLGTAAYNGRVGQSLVVILDFGSEWYANGGWGTDWTDLDGIFHPYTQAEAVVDAYADGFWVCTASDTGARLIIAAGVRNIFQSSPSPSTAGLAWAQLMTTFSNSLGIYASQVGVAGAIDAEPAWSSTTNALSWANSYSNANGLPYYDYGSADGCPPYGSCNNGWSQSVEYSMAWGIAAAGAIPEIYAQSGANATQWQRISLWGYLYGTYSRINFAATLTQYNACHSTSSRLAACTAAGTDNLPVNAWTQLLDDCQADSRTYLSTINWTTDINWG